MADSQVTNRVNELEGELRQLSLANGAMAFLTTSGMLSSLSILESRLLDLFQGWKSRQLIRKRHANNSST
jgi:hypothetical protein